MDKKHLSKILATALGVFLVCWLMVNTALIFSNFDEKVIKALHEKEAQIEMSLQSEKTKRTEYQTQEDYYKALRMETETIIIQLREERAKVIEERNSIINKTENSPISGEFSEALEKVPLSSFAENSINQTDEEVKLNCLAHAVAVAETSNCTTGKGVTHNNCHGIKNGSIAPCKKIVGSFCYYESTDQSFEAFKKIWVEGYGGGFPTKGMASTWTGNSNPSIWLNNVTIAYNECIQDMDYDV